MWKQPCCTLVTGTYTYLYIIGSVPLSVQQNLLFSRLSWKKSVTSISARKLRVKLQRTLHLEYVCIAQIIMLSIGLMLTASGQSLLPMYNLWGYQYLTCRHLKTRLRLPYIKNSCSFLDMTGGCRAASTEMHPHCLKHSKESISDIRLTASSARSDRGVIQTAFYNDQNFENLSGRCF